MSKITEINYRLPEVFAETFIRELSSSANKPLLIRGRDMLTSEKDDFILKPKGGLRMYEEAGMLELLASFIASELNLYVPEPVLIHISKSFIESLYGNDNYQRISNSEGINFGTKYLKDSSIWQDNPNLIKYHLKDLQEIFIFDMLIDNTDRTTIKPNIIINNENIYILDHEIAFAFAFLIIPNKHNPWEITDYERRAANNHILYQTLKGKEFLCDGFMDSIEVLNNVFWEKVESLLPNEWINKKFSAIKTNIQSKRNNLNKYKTNIQRLLV